jgi:hypothetical protein
MPSTTRTTTTTMMARVPKPREDEPPEVDSSGVSVGALVRTAVGANDGAFVGAVGAVGDDDAVGALVGVNVGDIVTGAAVGANVGGIVAGAGVVGIDVG